MREMASALLLALAGTASLLAMALSPQAGRSALIVFPPSTGAVAAFERVISAGWLPVATPWSNVILAHPGEQAEAPGDHGAWLVLDARGAGGCN